VKSSAGFSIVLFDAVCPLCTRSARIIARNDPMNQFRFAALQSPAGKEFIRQSGIREAHMAGASLALLSNGEWFQTSEAALKIAAALGRPWSCAILLRLLPFWLREWMYRTVASHRPRRESACVLGEELSSRLLPDGNVV